MKDEIKEILEKPNVYSFADETYLYFGDYNKLKYYITNLQKENEDYKSRVEKAVEYIKNDLHISILPNNQIINGKEVIKRINKIINILQNGSDEE